jgi:tRNA pseudouridine55 synthase
VISVQSPPAPGDTPIDNEAASESRGGVLPIDKPVGMTSHDVVDVVRRLYKTRRVGHTGTLDPAASGLLLIVIGAATRVASYLSGQDKTYRATVRFGATSTTGDSDGQITPTGNAQAPDQGIITGILPRFTGAIDMPVPDYAAVRSDGTRRYELARRGRPVPPAQRRVTIHDLTLLSYHPPEAEVLVRCSSGTYIRALASALGEAAGCGAYLGALRREAVGRHKVADALTLDELNRLAATDQLPAPRPIDDFLELPEVTISPEGVDLVRHGRPLRRTEIRGVQGEFGEDDPVAVRVEGGGIVAIARARFGSDRWPLADAETGEPVLRYACVLVWNRHSS